MSDDPWWRAVLIRAGAVLVFLLGFAGGLYAVVFGVLALVLLVQAGSSGAFLSDALEALLGAAVSAGVALAGVNISEWLVRSPTGGGRKTAAAAGSIAAAALLAIPPMMEFSKMVRRGAEGEAKGRLGSMRAAISMYRDDHHEAYPADLAALTEDGKYLARIPDVRVPPYHDRSPRAAYGARPDDAGGWLYDNVPGERGFGAVWVNCTHTDTKGSAWTAY